MKTKQLSKSGAHRVSKGILLSGFLLLLILTPQICAHASTSLAQTFGISGRVTDGFGNAISNATVTLSGTQSGTTATDAAGKYSFANLQGGGNYVLSPSKAGQYVASNNVVNNLSRDITVNLRLEPQVRFNVRVADAAGYGLASVALRVNDQAVKPAQTNPAGIAEVNVGTEAVGDSMIKLVAENPGFVFNPPSLTFHSRDGNQVVNITGTPTDLPVSFIQFSSPAYIVGEGDGSINITVTRTGDTSGPVSVSYATSDTATATQKSDYVTAAGTLSFAAGETTKSFQVLIVDNAYPQGTHAFSVALTNPTGGATLADPSVATVTIVDNDTSTTTLNPLDDPQFFVRQHYYDFLNRQPDASGGAFWTNQITSCDKGDQHCIEIKRINVSAAFFLSIEFQQTGYLVERLYKTSYGDATGTSNVGGAHQLPVPVIRYNEFVSDTQEIGQGIVVGQGNWQQQLENNKQAFTTEFVQRSRFSSTFPTSMTPAEFVDKLNGNAGSPLSQSERDQLVTDLSANAKTRAQVLRVMAENPSLVQTEFNRAFVLMEYFAYLRRNPNGPPDNDYGGYDFWLTKLAKFKGNFVEAEMVKAFITSIEYRQRFGPRVDTTPPTIGFTVTPAPNAAGWNNSNPTVTFTCADSGSGIAFCTEPVTITTETASQIVEGVAVDNSGNSAAVSVTVKLDKTPPSVTVTSPADGSKAFFSPVAVAGTVVDALSGLASATCNGTAANVSGNSFTCSVTLTPGANSVNASAIDVAGNSSKSSLALAYARPPTVTISSPINLSYLNISPTTVTGTVDDPTATVTVNSVQAAVVNGSFSVALPLAEGPNTISATVTSATGTVGTASIQATLDTTPPHVTITSPPDQFVTTDTSITVAGNVNDIVVGTVNAEQAQVSVNGSLAQVANRAFLAMNVPLAIGPNVIQAVGRDRVGNAATTEITVTRQAPGQPQIRLISGNNQTGIIGSVLSDPLVVSVVDGSNNPIPNKPVIFKVTQDNGMVSTGGPSAATVIATTDAQGQAQAQWKLGMRSGAGANSVEAYSVGFDGTAIFTATGTQGPAGKIVIDTGNDQIGAANQPLPKPLIAVVVDDGNNRLAGVPVTFTVKEGGAKFGGQPTVTVNTDSDGRVAATLTLGLQEGNANNLVEATFPSNTSFPASFTASGRAPADPSKTNISGVVLDNSNVPIPGVTIRAVLTNMLTANSTVVQTLTGIQTDQQGQFFIPQAPVGFVKLLVDGSTAQRPGVYPTLDYDLVTVAGQDNKLSMPIFLLPLNPDNKLCVTATTGGGTLTIPEAPGFSLTFGPGQVTFPGGSKTGCVSVTVVHGDKVPMVPGFGQQPRFIVTIQPSGAVFNLPASITLPNVDGLKPREVTEMYSFDHDIGSFVAIGTGTVSDDGQVIRSNPGVGVLKAGWHCGGNPNSTGSTASLSLSVTPDKAVVTIGEQFELTASGGPPLDGKYEWTPGSNVQGVSTPGCAGQGTCLGKFKGTTSGTATIKVCFRCTTTGAVKCQDVPITVVKIELKKLTFKTDHGLMRDNNGNFTSSGSVFTKPDWNDAGKNNPISHTMNQSVGLELEFQVTPDNAPSRSYKIKGAGPTGLNYAGTVDLAGGTNTKAFTSSDKLESKVQKLTGEINWELTKDGEVVMTKSTGSHTVYVTIGTPRNDSNSVNAVTQLRMERAVQQVAAANSLDPNTIVKTVIQAQGNFDLNSPQANEWLVPDNGGDCQSIVRFTAVVLNMINVPGIVLHKNVYAIETNPTQGIEVDGATHGGLNTDVRRHPNLIWILSLIDFGDGCNAFEATAKFTDNGITKYYAGGTTGIFDNPNKVLTVFHTMSWVDVVMVNGQPQCTVKQLVFNYHP